MRKLHQALSDGYVSLGKAFFEPHELQPVKAPQLRLLNRDLAEQLQVDADDEQLTALLAGNLAPENAAMVATAYAGHQFGQFVPRLGDGRACLLGEIQDRKGVWQDVQLKGSGVTAFARRGDGRSALGPALREYIISEAMYALGIPTTRSLAVVSTGEMVQRETPQPGGVVTRVAESHIRVGSFQYFQFNNDINGLKKLADYAIQRHDPDLKKSQRPYLSFLERVVQRQAKLIAQWLQVGFVHGVMNTDNCTVSGQTIDFGPCAFIDRYHSDAVFSSIDFQGRYAYWNQPKLALWNLTRLAESLLPLIQDEVSDEVETVNEVLESFEVLFSSAYLDGMRAKLGLQKAVDGDMQLITKLLALMEQQKVDYTLFFRHLPDYLTSDKKDAFSEWVDLWKSRLEKEEREQTEMIDLMNANNPVYIPRNHLVEQAILEAVENNNYSYINKLNSILKNSFDVIQGQELYANPPDNEDSSYQTFCGT